MSNYLIQVVLELGGYQNFSLDELKEIKSPPFGLGIERDKWFKPTPLNEIKQLK